MEHQWCAIRVDHAAALDFTDEAPAASAQSCANEALTEDCRSYSHGSDTPPGYIMLSDFRNDTGNYLYIGNEWAYWSLGDGIDKDARCSSDDDHCDVVLWGRRTGPFDSETTDPATS